MAVSSPRALLYTTSLTNPLQPLFLHGSRRPSHPSHLVLGRLLSVHDHDRSYAVRQHPPCTMGLRGILLHLLRRLFLGHSPSLLDVRSGDHATAHP